MKTKLLCRMFNAQKPEPCQIDFPGIDAGEICAYLEDMCDKYMKDNIIPDRSHCEHWNYVEIEIDETTK